MEIQVLCTHILGIFSLHFYTGICKCDDGYGGGDCSVDTNDPPPVYAVNYETGGLCDKLFCKQAVVEGDFFLDRPELTCSMQKFEVYPAIKNVVD